MADTLDHYFDFPYNTATRLTFATRKGGAIVTGINWTNSRKWISKDGGSFSTLTNSPSEIGSYGVHTCVISATESSCEYFIVMFQSTTAEFDTMFLHCNTVAGDNTNARFVTTDVNVVEVAGSSVATWQADLVDDVWDEVASGHVTAGSISKVLQDIPNETWSVDFSSESASGTFGSIQYALNSGQFVVQTGSSSTEVRTNSSHADDTFNGQLLVVANAAGTVSRRITDFSNTNGAFTVSPAFPYTPAFGNLAMVLPATSNLDSTLDGATISEAVWDAATASYGTSGSYGLLVEGFDTDLTNIETKIDTVDGIVDAILVDTGTTIPGLISGLNDPTAATIADAVLDEALSGHTTAGTLGKAIADIETDAAAILVDTGTTLPATLSTIDGKIDTIDGIVDSILVDTDTTIPGLISGLNDLSAAQVNSEVDTALVDIGLDHLLSASVAGTDIANDSIIAQLVSKSATADWDSFDNTTDALEALADAPSAPTSAAIADAVWDELLSGHTTAGTFGKAIADTETDAAAILVDTGTTLPATLSTIDGKIDTIDGIVDSILVDTDTTIPGLISGLNDPTAAAIADAVLDEALSGHTTAGTLGKAIADIETDAAAILVDTGTTLPATLSTIDGIVDAILVDTDTTIPGLISGLNDLSAAQVNAEVDTALVDIGLDHLLSTSVAGTDVVDNSILAKLVSKSATADWDSFDNTTDSLEAIADGSGGGGPTAAQIADAVWTETLADHSGTSGSTAEALNTAATSSSLTVADIADGVWDELLSGHTSAGSAGKYLVDILDDTSTSIPADISALAIPTAAQNADAVWDELTADHTDPGSYGLALGTTIQSTLTTIDTVVDAILVDTGTTLPATLATASALATVDANVDAVLVDTDTTIPGLIAALNDPTAATIADAVWDESASGHTTAGTFGKILQDLETDLAAVDANVDAILVDTDTTIPGLIGGLNDFNPSTDSVFLSTSGNNAIADAVLDEALSGHTTAGTLGKAVADIETDAAAILVDTDTTIPGLIAALNDLSTTDVAGAVWNAAVASYNTSGSFGEETQLHALSSEVSSLATASDLAVVDANVDAILVDTDTTIPATLATLATASDLSVVDGIVDAILVDTGTTLPSTLSTIESKIDTVDGIVDAILVDTDTTIPGLISGLNDPTAAAIADAVWDEALAGHTVLGSAGDALGNVASPPSAATIADAVLDEALSGHTTAGTLGKAVADIESDATDILVDTGTTLPATLATLATAASVSALNDLSTSDVQSALDAQGYTTGRAALLSNLDVAISTVNSAVGALNDLSTADIQSAMTSQGYTSVRGALLDNLDAAISTVVNAVNVLNDLSSADITSALTSQGLTTTRAGYLDNLPTILTGSERSRKINGNKVVISADDQTVTIYEDDDTTVAFTFTVSADGRTRTPD